MKNTKRTVLFQDHESVEAVVLAQLGRSNKSIALSCPSLVSHGRKNPHNKINYRLTIAKNLYGLPPGEGFRYQWRNGTSELAQQVAREIVPMLRRQLVKSLPRMIARPTPEITES
jgi:hypothetical protein